MPTKAPVKVDPQQIKTFKQFLATLPAEFIECRRYRHAWSGETVGVGKREYTVTLRCLRCKSTATEIVNRHGDLMRKRQIHYVEGYLMHGLGTMDADRRAALRIESVKRFEF